MSAGTSCVLPTATYAGYDTTGANARNLWLPADNGVVSGDVIITGTLTVDGVTQMNSALTVGGSVSSTTAGDSVALQSTSSSPSVLFTNSAGNTTTLVVDNSNTLSILGTPSAPLVNAPGGLVAPSISGPTASSPSFPYGLISAGNVVGINSIRDRVVNYTDAVTDQTIVWAGSTYYISALVQGAGPGWTAIIELPADIATNPAYRGMQIFKANILIPSTTRNVGISVRNNAGTVLLGGTLTHGGFWNVDCMLGAPGDVNNALGLYLTYQNSTNMQAA